MKKILEVKNLSKSFYKSKGSFPAVEDVSFQVMQGECLGLVGESGCGKSTTARLIAGLLKPDRGSVRLDGEEILGLKGKKKQALYTKLQMVFQTPQDSFDPRCTLGDGIMESMRNRGMKKEQAREKMRRLLEQVELNPGLGDRYAYQVSGGECQRAAIARALAPDPELIICDEATSALDVTVQIQIVELLKRLQQDRKLSLLFICHDLALVQHMCQRVLVMYQGKIIEQGSPEEVIQHPRKEYTRILVDSAL